MAQLEAEAWTFGVHQILVMLGHPGLPERVKFLFRAQNALIQRRKMEEVVSNRPLLVSAEATEAHFRNEWLSWQFSSLATMECETVAG